MNICEKRIIDILRYLDNELRGHELDQFRAHLELCAYCRNHLEEERVLSRMLHRTRPLYLAPPALRRQVSATLTEHPVPPKS